MIHFNFIVDDEEVETIFQCIRESVNGQNVTS